MSNASYHIPVWGTITASWDKVGGSKKTFWGALIIFFVIMFLCGFVQGMLGKGFGSGVIKVIANVIGYFLQMGLIYIGIRRAADLPIEYQQMFRAFNLDIAIKIVLLYILQIVIFIPVVLVLAGMGALSATMADISPIIPIIVFSLGGFAVVYLAVRMMVSNAYVLDKAMGPWEAIKMSFKATRCNFWRLVGIVILELIILAISAIPFGIGLIWTLPLTFIIFGLVYHHLQANVEPVAVTSTTI